MKIIILLVIMYGRGEKSIAEQLGCSVEEAKSIKDNVYDAFPKIKTFERSSSLMVKSNGYVTTLWGRKRRLPDYNLPNYEFYYVDNNGNKLDMPVPKEIVDEHTNKLNSLYWKSKEDYITNLRNKHNIVVVNNQSKIAAAGRQIINSRVQGCLDGDSEIIIKDIGKSKIKDHINETVDIWDGSDWTPGTIVESGKKQKCIITFEDNSQIICSPDHRFRVIQKDGTKVWKKCKELLDSDEIDSI